MNIDTNELANKRALESMLEEEYKRFTPIPDELQNAARNMLREQDRVFVPHDNNPLNRWAEEQRRKKHKAEKQARKQQRR
jgi:Mn-containing catalase